MANAANPWPDLNHPPALTPPAVVLGEIASMLGEKTKNIVYAHVVPCPSGHRFRQDLGYDLALVAPNLNHFEYRLLTIHQKGVEPYPVEIDWVEKSVEAANEAEFRDQLATVLASEATRKVVDQLYYSSLGLHPEEMESEDQV